MSDFPDFAHIREIQRDRLLAADHIRQADRVKAATAIHRIPVLNLLVLLLGDQRVRRHTQTND